MPISASMLRAHLDCEHRTWMDAFGDRAEKRATSPFQQMLFDEGLLHEKRLVEGASRGTPIVDLSALRGDEKEAATRDWIAKGAALIYQGRLTTANLVGEPDLLQREGERYAPIDIKSGAALHKNGTPKLEYGVQIALYVELLEAARLSAGPYGYIWAGDGARVRYDIDARLGAAPGVTLRSEYLALHAAVEPIVAGAVRTEPAASSACKQCGWQPACYHVLKAADDLTMLAELGRAKRAALRDAFPTVQALAVADLAPHLRKTGSPFPGIGAATLTTFQARARMMKDPAPVPYFREALPLPSAEVELFFDIEDCMVRGIVYLHGFVIREGGIGGRERFVDAFAHPADADGERAAFAQAIRVFREHPDALIVYYSTHERTKYRELQARFPDVCSLDEVEALFDGRRSLDLLTAARASIWPTPDLSVKSIAKFCGFAWRDQDPSGAASVEWFHRYVTEGDPAVKQRILDYNEDDCRAMRVVLDRMRGMGVREL